MRVNAVSHKIRKPKTNNAVIRKNKNQQQNGGEVPQTSRLNVSARVKKIVHNAKKARVSAKSPSPKASKLSEEAIRKELCSSGHSNKCGQKVNMKVISNLNVKRRLSYNSRASGPPPPCKKIVFGMAGGNEEEKRRGFPVPTKKTVTTASSTSTAIQHKNKEIQHPEAGEKSTHPSTNSDIEFKSSAEKGNVCTSEEMLIALMRSRKCQGGGADYGRRLFKALYKKEEIITMTAKGKGKSQKCVSQDVLDAVELEVLDKYKYILYFTNEGKARKVDEKTHDGKKRRFRKKPSEKVFPPGVVPIGKIAREVSIVDSAEMNQQAHHHPPSSPPQVREGEKSRTASEMPEVTTGPTLPSTPKLLSASMPKGHESGA
ncbi:UNVERIFIED_CONTAM: hypothetical protein B566_EDAN017697, partial [Ephemera danica]